MKQAKKRQRTTNRMFLETQMGLRVRIARRKNAALMTICSTVSTSGGMGMELAVRIQISTAIANAINRSINKLR